MVPIEPSRPAERRRRWSRIAVVGLAADAGDVVRTAVRGRCRQWRRAVEQVQEEVDPIEEGVDDAIPIGLARRLAGRGSSIDEPELDDPDDIRDIDMAVDVAIAAYEIGLSGDRRSNDAEENSDQQGGGVDLHGVLPLRTRVRYRSCSPPGSYTIPGENTHSTKRSSFVDRGP